MQLIFSKICITFLVCIVCIKSSAQSWIHDSHKKAIQATDEIKDNIIAYKKLDSLNKIVKLNPRNKTEALLRLAMVNVKIQKLDEALDYCLKGLEIAEKNNFDTAYITFYKIIGAINYYTGKYNEAIKYFSKSGALAKEKGILYLVVTNYQNLGGVFLDLKKNDSAEFYLNKSLILSSNCGSKCTIARNTANRLLATLYEREKKYLLAHSLYKQGESEARQLNDSIQICSYLIFSAELFAKTNNLPKAIIKAEEALKIMRVQRNRNEHSFQFALTFLAKKLDLIGRYKEASSLRNEALELYKTIAKKESQKHINELETQFKVKEIEQEKNLAIANALAQKQQKQILYILLGGILVLATFSFLFIQQRNKQQQAEQKAVSQKNLLQSILETEEKERSRIAKDLHDGIVQDLTAIKIDLQATAQLLSTELQEKIQPIYQAVDVAVKEVREISYQMMPITLKELGLVKAIEELLGRTLVKNNIQYHFDYFGIEERLSEKIEVTVYRICQELLNNTIKHSQAKNVSLLLQLKNKILQLTFEDDGIGFNSSTIRKGIGLNSLGSRIEMVKGSLEFDSTESNGTTAYIRIPL